MSALPSFEFIYLASQSPRRRQLLEQIGMKLELLLPGPEEDAEALEEVIAGEKPEAYVERVTQAKLDAALVRLGRRDLKPAPVLCSDTTVALGDRILGKPADADDALATLESLAGRRHRVITAVAVGLGERRLTRLSVSEVEFAPVSRERLQRYVDSGQPFGKAGSYAIQSDAAVWITHIAGSYSGIMGLPLHETAVLLQQWGFEV
ncbi:Maf family protein [Pelomonas sp. SE-A7]|uniref:Maf family protein n=1 Tax=Pelomonas sp. SE-A7 TaxID=3054953 RepID=UPI00259C982A|nr:Maf family protein [Pelomonas sp. SE-A7]MDM4765888.1 Maf family protein [Pelomonas sp. SE-A7]